MNTAHIIGNLVRDPDMRITPGGISVCSFTVAVNRRRREGQPEEADYFRVTTWREQAESCGKYLKKGNKVAVAGQVSVSTYQAKDGSTKAALEVQAQNVEFLSPKEEKKPVEAKKIEYVEVTDEELPF